MFSKHKIIFVITIVYIVSTGRKSVFYSWTFSERKVGQLWDIVFKRKWGICRYCNERIYLNPQKSQPVQWIAAMNFLFHITSYVISLDSSAAIGDTVK